MNKENKVRSLDEVRDEIAESYKLNQGASALGLPGAVKFGWGACHAHLLEQAGEKAELDVDEVNQRFTAPFKGMGEMYALQKGLEIGIDTQYIRQAAREGALKLEIEHWSKKYGQYVDKWCDQEKELSALRNHHADLDMIIRAERNDNMALREEIERLKNGK